MKRINSVVLPFLATVLITLGSYRDIGEIRSGLYSDIEPKGIRSLIDDVQLFEHSAGGHHIFIHLIEEGDWLLFQAVVESKRTHNKNSTTDADPYAADLKLVYIESDEPSLAIRPLVTRGFVFEKNGSRHGAVMQEDVYSFSVHKDHLNKVVVVFTLPTYLRVYLWEEPLSAIYNEWISGSHDPVEEKR